MFLTILRRTFDGGDQCWHHDPIRVELSHVVLVHRQGKVVFPCYNGLVLRLFPRCLLPGLATGGLSPRQIAQWQQKAVVVVVVIVVVVVLEIHPHPMIINPRPCCCWSLTRRRCNVRTRREMLLPYARVRLVLLDDGVKLPSSKLLSASSTPPHDLPIYNIHSLHYIMFRSMER